jgi:hypothetical protein
MQRIWAAALLILSSTPIVGQAEEKQFSAAARFRAAGLILAEFARSVAEFQYPNLNPTDFPEKLSPYQEFIKNISLDLKDDGALDDQKRAALSFFCTTGLSNIENLLMMYPNALLVPKSPGDTPEKLRKTHALAFEFFEEQKRLYEMVAPIVGCTSLEPIF